MYANKIISFTFFLIVFYDYFPDLPSQKNYSGV